MFKVPVELNDNSPPTLRQGSTPKTCTKSLNPMRQPRVPSCSDRLWRKIYREEKSFSLVEPGNLAVKQTQQQYNVTMPNQINSNLLFAKSTKGN